MIAWLRYLKRLLKMPWGDSSWSPHWALEGEDILVGLFLRRNDGQPATATYIDVGAHQPRRYSTTYALYRCGWRGLLVEPNPTLVSAIRRGRPKDVVEQCGVSDVTGEMDFYLYSQACYSTFSEQQKRQLEDSQNLRPMRTLRTKVVTLAALEAKYPTLFRQARLLKVDAEGHDLNVLRSNNWNSFRPEYIVVEMLGQSARTASDHEIGEFLRANGYALRSFLYHSAVWERVTLEGNSRIPK